jgi:3-oxoadipate enol-lactonase
MKIQLGDIETAYNVYGEGPPLVLIHGLAEDKESWSVIQQNLKNFRTYAYDLRGHGYSTLGSGEGTLEQLGCDLIAFLEKVSGPAKCVGYSLGGTLLLWAAVKKPKLISAAVVAGTSTVVGKQALGFFKERVRMIRDEFSAFAPTLRNDTELQIVNSGVDLEAIVANRLEAVGDGAGYVNAALAMMCLHVNPLTPLLSKIECPVSVIGGENDIFCPSKAADIMLSKLSKGTYLEVANAGHLLSIDQPETYANAIRSALQRKN